MPRLFQPNKSKPITPVFNVANLGGGETEITLYGEVMEESPKDYWSGESLDGVYISVQEFNEKLDEIKEYIHITVHLNSCGGDLFAGLAIHNVLKALPATITVKVEGDARHPPHRSSRARVTRSLSCPAPSSWCTARRRFCSATTTPATSPPCAAR